MGRHKNNLKTTTSVFAIVLKTLFSFPISGKIRLKKFCITHHPHVGFSSLALLTFLHYILPLPPPSLVKLLRAYYCNLLPNLYSILLCFQNKARERTRVGILVFIFLNKKISSYPKRYMIPAPFKNEIP